MSSFTLNEALIPARIDIFCDAAVAALIFYEYSLTFLNEIRFIWRGKFSGVTVLFLLNRYTTLSNQILGIACFWRQEQGLISTTTLCNIVWQGHTVGQCVLYGVLAVFSALRVYALWDKNYILAALILFLGMVNPCLTAYYGAITREVNSISAPLACSIDTHNVNPTLNGLISNLTLASTVATELAVVILTWIKTAGVRRALSRANIATPLLTLLVRDGTVAFVLCAALAILGNIPQTSIFSMLEQPIISICISRFVIGLRQVYLSDSTYASQPSESASVMSRIVGNSGAPVDFDLDEDEQEDGTVYVSHHPLIISFVLELSDEDGY